MTTANAIRSIIENLERLGRVEPAPPWECSPWHIEESEPAVRKFGYGIVCNAPSDDLAALIVAYRNNHAQILSALRVAEVVPEIEDAIEQIYSTATDPRANVGFPPTRKELEGGLEVIKAISGEAIKLLQSAKEPTP